MSMDKPPIGIMPRRIHDLKRLRALQSVISRYLDADWEISLDWIAEYNELVARNRARESEHA